MKKEKQKLRTRLKSLKILGLGAGGLVGLFVLAFFVLPTVCPSCAIWLPTTNEPSAPMQASNGTSVPVGIKVGERAPDFTLTDIDGRDVHLRDLRSKPVILYFSASWCTSCIPETRELAQLDDRYRDLRIVWISVSPATDSPDALREHRSRYARKDFIYALDTSSNELARQYQVYALGTVYLLNRDQAIVFRGVGSVSTQDFQQALEQAVRP